MATRVDFRGAGADKAPKKTTLDAPVPLKRKQRTVLYCVCQQPNDHRPYVRCDRCNKWFHFDCLEKYGCKVDVDESGQLRRGAKVCCVLCKDDVSAASAAPRAKRARR